MNRNSQTTGCTGLSDKILKNQQTKTIRTSSAEVITIRQPAKHLTTALVQNSHFFCLIVIAKEVTQESSL